MPDLVMLIVSAVVAALVAPLMQLLKKASAWVDSQSTLIKRLLVILLAAVGTVLSTVLGLPVPDNILGIDAEALQTLLTAGLAMLYHLLFKKSTQPTA